MIFEQILIGGDRNYAYLVGDETTKKAAVADPAYHPEKMLARAAELGLEVVYLINTHGHPDHTSGNDHILSETKAELISGKVKDGAVYSLGKVELKVIRTPGHTTDSVCVLATAAGEVGQLITGDTLFVGKVGGTGFGADAEAEYESLHKKLMVLPPDTEVWPGHNYGVAPSSTIGNELKTNPFIMRESFEAFVDLKRNWAAYKEEHGIT
jgi:hydroxyacylglutathione hydrolase